MRRLLFGIALSFAVMAGFCAPAFAQFNSQGADPGGKKWMHVKTAHYDVIYPKGSDSLAFRYGQTLEKYYRPVSLSTGFVPDSAFTRKVPVILHSFTEESNGMVSLAPHRVELYTTPDMTAPLSVPWEEHLISHESRHLSQMNFAFFDGWRGPWYVLGEIGSTLPYLFYTDLSWLEGDAVVMETALSASGRGRFAEFLEYYNNSLVNGGQRSWYQWRYGSLRKFTPSYYALGYITVAGLRTIWDEPYFPKVMTDRRSRKGLPFLNFPKTVKDVSGKYLRGAFNEICDTLAAEKRALDASRGPIMEAEQITFDSKHFNLWVGAVPVGSDLYVVRSGLDRTPAMYRIDSLGRQTMVHSMNAKCLGLFPGDADAPIWWNEHRPDVRWSLKSSMAVCYMDADGHFHDFLTGGKYFFPEVRKNYVTATQLDDDGNTYIVRFNRSDAKEMFRIKAPRGFQFVDTATRGDELYTSALSSEGFGIYKVEDGQLKEVLAPAHVSVTKVACNGEDILFESDRTGVREWYKLKLSNGKLYQMTNTLDGGKFWGITPDRKYATFTALTTGGSNLYRIPLGNLMEKEVDFQERFVPKFAEELSAQEKTLAELAGLPPLEKFEADSCSISEPEKYNKLTHLFRLHSWAPFYADYDAIASKSFETAFTSVRLGASAFFQNNLGTFTAMTGLRVASDADWIPSWDGQFSYSGLYPVIEGSWSIGKVQSGRIRTYIPWTWFSSGWIRGLVPQLSYSISSKSLVLEDVSYVNSTLTAGLRGYVMKPTAASGIYPRYGVGAEVSLATYPTIAPVNSNYYGYLYFYLPGIMRTHGMKFTAMAESYFGGKKYCTPYASVAPRGIVSRNLSSLLCSFPLQSKYTFDYAFPFAPVDWDALCPVFYVRNFEATLHGDFSYFYQSRGVDGNLASVGADLAVVLGNFIWLPYTTRIGISYNYNFGGSFDAINAVLSDKGLALLERNRVSLVFSVAF